MNEPLLSLLYTIVGSRERIVHAEQLPPRPARYADPSVPLPPALRDALAARGIDRLYTHQAAALDAAHAGAHVGIMTQTASGKTLCYLLPVLEALLEDNHCRALLLFPTKALAHDQLRTLHDLLATLDKTGASQRSPPAISAATLDGDTPRPARDDVRAHAQIVLSNPDMLHRSVLPDHRRWSGWLARLRYLVLDEAHSYRGIFGTHVALIIRRLQRLCAYYGARPQVICCSATSANPAEHLAALVGGPVTVIAEDGAPQGRRTFVFWNPPVIEDRRQTTRDARRWDAWRGGMEHMFPQASGRPLSPSPGTESGRRRSTNVETAHLLAALVRGDVKTLAFARSRRAAELILRYTREALEAAGQEHPTGAALPIAAYRAGYRPDERRALEQAFGRGDVRGLVSTNALELGVDIGGVDAVVIGGFPGTIASTWQQAGRAGRSQGESVAVLVAQDDPLDQFYMRHPAQFFARSHEQARIALRNPYILLDQLCCAAAELPITPNDERWFGETTAALCKWLIRHGRLQIHDDSRIVAVERWPSANVNIRSADGGVIMLRDAESGRVIEQISLSRAPFEVFPGAVYLHQGDTYLVERMADQEALARRAQVEYYTQPRDITDIAIEQVLMQRPCGPLMLCLGVVSVTRQVTGYRRKKHYSETILSEHSLSMPPQTFRTQAVWWTVPDPISAGLAQACGDLPGALHAMEHAAIALLPLFAQCDRWDIGGLSTAQHPDTTLATIFVYDGVPGGVGIAQTGYDQAEAWWAATRDLLRDCPCGEGCPSCIQSPKCGSGNQPLSKEGAWMLADALLGQGLPGSRLLGAAPVTGRSEEQRTAVLADLRERLERAQATPAGLQRELQLATLRYRIASERAGPLGKDDEALATMASIEHAISAASKR